MSILPFNCLSDDDFVLTLNDDGQFRSIECLSNMRFNIFDSNSCRYIQDVDPDNYLINNLKYDKDNCKYYCGSDVLGACDVSSSDKFSMLSLNINSLPLHFDSFSYMIEEELQSSFDIIALCETKLDDNITELYNIENYTMFVNNNSRRSGGLAIYIRSLHSNLKQRTDLSYKFDYLESLFVEVPQGSKNVIIGVVYRRPGTPTESFLNKMSDILNVISNENKICYLMGDFNLDLLKHNSSQPVFDFATMMTSQNFFPSINIPTRVTDKSATIIDHVWSNNIGDISNSGVIFSHFPDHFPVFSCFKKHSFLKSNEKFDFMPRFL